MSERIFPTAQDAENAFYEALERADLEAMMAVWAEDEDIVCVHPTGPRLAGQEQVRESWAQIFSGGARTQVHVTRQLVITGMMMAIHSVQENFIVESDARAQASAQPQGRDSRPLPIVATNVYQRSAAGWRMVLHHASPAPGEATSAPAARAAAPKFLH